jgi:hypothetical protein
VPVLRALVSREGSGFRRSVATTDPPNYYLACWFDAAQGSPPALNKTCTESVRRNWYRFGAISGSLHQFCPVEQLFSPRLRATFERKLKYETAHTIVYPESLQAGGSKGLP